MGPIATDVACVSHCLVFVSTMSCANMAEPIEMPFAVWTQVSPVDWVGRLGPEPPSQLLQQNGLYQIIKLQLKASLVNVRV